MSRPKMVITGREQEILDLQTDSIKEISEKLEISTNQVRNHIRDLQNKGLWPYNYEFKRYSDNELQLINQCIELVNKLSPEAIIYLKLTIK